MINLHETDGQVMTDYTELVKALRCKRDDCEGCDLAFLDNDEGWMCQYAAKDDDAAAAIEALQADIKRLKEANDELREAQTYIDHYGDRWLTSAKDVPTAAYEHGYADGRDEAIAKMDGPIITPCRGCSDYDGYGGCKSKGGCSRAKMEVQDEGAGSV